VESAVTGAEETLQTRDLTMMLCGCWFLQMAVLVLLAWPPFSARGLRCRGDRPTKADKANLIVRKYAYEAYPQWAWAHRETRCPRALVELDEHINDKDTRDPWGRPYRMICVERGVVVYSGGPDGYVGTDDDIWSNR
jgi:hypothetical protein